MSRALVEIPSQDVPPPNGARSEYPGYTNTRGRPIQRDSKPSVRTDYLRNRGHPIG